MIPLVPFLIGATVGAVTTYLVKSPAVQQSVKDGAEKVSDGVKAGVDKAKSAMSRNKDVEEKVVADEAPAAETPA